ncbi:MAG: hypothetical protein OEQ53_06670 [Saprospiraceae bacterium]|nr:hypothetical protein [Saprospiraceae bacterium]
MKKSTVTKLHLYCGLFTSFYLIAFGLSSIILNHKIDIENRTIERVWTDQVTVDPSLEDGEFAEDVRDQLGLMGWLPRWQFQRDSIFFRFHTTHLAKTNKIRLDLKTGEVEISEIPKGFLAVLHGLHFYNGKIPNAPFFLRTWVVYQWLTLLVLFTSLVLGLWLWLKYSRKTWELYLFGGLFALSILIMLLL